MATESSRNVVEDDQAKSDVNLPTGSQACSQVEKPAVEDPGASSDGVVDREKPTVEDPDASSDGVVDREKPTVEDPDPSSDGVVDHEKPTVEDPGASEMQGKWTIQLLVDPTSHEAIVRKLPLKECFLWNTSILFGRGMDANIFVNDERASKQHVELIGQILPNGQVYFMVRNVSSTQGFKLNDRNITKNDNWTVVNRGDTISISRLVMKVNILPGLMKSNNFVLEFVRAPPKEPDTADIPTAIYLMSPPMRSPQSFFGPAPAFQANLQGNFMPYADYSSLHSPPITGIPQHSRWQTPGIVPRGQFFPAGGHTNLPHDYFDQILRQLLTIEGGVKIEELRIVAFEAVGEWKVLGRALGLFDWQIEAIDLDYLKHAEKCYQILRTWVCMNPFGATRDNLRRALRDRIVGRSDLAEKYFADVSAQGNRWKFKREEIGNSKV